MEKIRIGNESYNLVCVENKYKRVKSFDAEKLYENYKLQDNQIFMVVSDENEIWKVFVLEFNVILPTKKAH